MKKIAYLTLFILLPFALFSRGKIATLSTKYSENTPTNKKILNSSTSIKYPLSTIDLKEITEPKSTVSSPLYDEYIPFAEKEIQTNNLIETIEKLVNKTSDNKLYKTLIDSHIVPFLKQKNIESIDFMGAILNYSVCDIFIILDENIYSFEFFIESLEPFESAENKSISPNYVGKIDSKIKNDLKYLRENPEKKYVGFTSATGSKGYIIKDSNKYKSYFYNAHKTTKSSILNIFLYNLLEYTLKNRKNNGEKLKQRMWFI